MRAGTEVANCFPTGRHYPGLADRIARAIVAIEGLIEELDAGHSWARLPLAVIDFETTGTNPEIDRVLEIGIILVDGGEISATHGILVNPGIPISDESRAIHQITDEEIAAAPPFRAVLPRIVELLASRVPVAYNADFDRAFLHAEIARHRTVASSGSLPPAFRPGVAWVDPLVWAREILRDEVKSRRLNDVCEHLGISLERAHRAEGDAEATARVLLALSPKMPTSYGELVRIQTRYAAHQDVELAGFRR